MNINQKFFILCVFEKNLKILQIRSLCYKGCLFLRAKTDIFRQIDFNVRLGYCEKSLSFRALFTIMQLHKGRKDGCALSFLFFVKFVNLYVDFTIWTIIFFGFNVDRQCPKPGILPIINKQDCMAIAVQAAENRGQRAIWIRKK